MPSHFLAGEICALGVDEKRIQVLPGSVDSRFFEPAALPLEPRVAFVGRFVPKKGVDILLAAWSAVRRAIPDAELTLLGYGDPIPAPDPRAGIRVHTPDPTDPRRQVHDVIRRCRVYVAPSRTGPDGDAESQHIGNLEAQAAGRAVLSTRHDAIPEFVDDGRTGLLVAAGDHHALARALIDVLRDIPLCQRLGSAATAGAYRFTVPHIAAQHDTLHQDLAAESAGVPYRDRAGTSKNRNSSADYDDRAER